MPSLRRNKPEHSAGRPNRKSLPDSAHSFELTIEAIRSARASRDWIAGFRGSQELYLSLIAWLARADIGASSADAIISLFRTLDRLGARPLGPGRVYNETIVMFWIVVARQRVAAATATTPNEKAAAARAFAKAHADQHQLIYEFYRRSLVHSWRARLSWVEPDLKPIEALEQHPQHGTGSHGTPPQA